jgi:hypothetical protein
LDFGARTIVLSVDNTKAAVLLIGFSLFLAPLADRNESIRSGSGEICGCTLIHWQKAKICQDAPCETGLSRSLRRKSAGHERRAGLTDCKANCGKRAQDGLIPLPASDACRIKIQLSAAGEE